MCVRGALRTLVYRGAPRAPPLRRGFPSRDARRAPLTRAVDINFPQPKSPGRDALENRGVPMMVDRERTRRQRPLGYLGAQFDLCGHPLYR
jgi:hypothetical protein